MRRPTAGRPSLLRVVLQVISTVAAIILALWALHQIASVALVLIAASLFAYVIAPLVTLAEHPIRIAGRVAALPRAAAIGLVYVLLAAGIGGATALLLPSATEQAADAFASLPAYAQSVVTWEHGWVRYYERQRIPLELRHKINESAAAAGDAALASARQSIQTIAGSVSVLPWLLVIPVLAFFLLKDARSIRRIIVVALPLRLRLRSHRLFDDLNAMLAAYVHAQLLACALVGILCWLAFEAIGLPYAVLLGVLAGVLEFIPLVGPFLLAVLASSVGAFHGPAMALSTIGFLAALRIVEDYVIYPRLMRSGLELHPLAVILGVMAGAELNGVAGMFLAVPAVATATVIGRHWLLWRESDAAALVPGSPEALVQSGTRTRDSHRLQ